MFYSNVYLLHYLNSVLVWSDTMDKLRSRINLPKTRSLYLHPAYGSLETMIRDSLYLAWPVASASNTPSRRRGFLRKSRAVDEEDSSDSWVHSVECIDLVNVCVLCDDVITLIALYNIIEDHSQKFRIGFI